ncbi:transglutaminase-like cysteine peptidase [Pseudomonas lalucatii]|uniref:Transglutaminase-like cysteine peptidase n=1 Tax=Pseudomonas lalucatii TaxID=1424203 RepID=A0ABS5Q459_9PSED|nr:transglutaminase-like cysteine peptidase [Pseudomonas lalucatii]MBS7663533.1 transglutaminase-like cysteine peptidase [Pseudomonas lalucatii]
MTQNRPPKLHAPALRYLRILLATLLCAIAGPGRAEPTSALGSAIAEARLTSWHILIARGRDADERSKLEAVNDFINNAVAFGDDLDIWGEEEYWATPLQTLTRGRGDCEDFAIGKYFTLVRMGVPSDKLRLTFVKALSRNQAHMVLTYYPTPNAQPLVLDNLERDIRPAAERGDLLPVYAFNHHGIFLAKSPQQKSRQSPRMLSRWSELNERIVADGAGLPGTPAPRLDGGQG